MQEEQNTHPFNGLLSRTTWVSWYQKGKSSLDLNEARDVGIFGWQWNKLGHMQTICTSLQTDNHINTYTLSLNFYRRMLIPTHNRQCQSTEGTKNKTGDVFFFYWRELGLHFFSGLQLLHHRPRVTTEH